MDISTVERSFRERVTDEQWSQIQALGEVVSFADGAIVMRRGEPPEWLYLVLTGGLIVVDPRTSPPTVLTRREPGHLFGEISFMDGNPVSAEVRADEATTCLRFSVVDLPIQLREMPQLDATFHRALAAALAWRVRQLTTSAVTGALTPWRDETPSRPPSASQPGPRDLLLAALLAEQEAGPRSVQLAGDRVTIGSGPSADLRVDDPRVAPVHAELVRTDDGWRVVSLTERAVVVNGTPVNSAPAVDGLELGVGRATVELKGGAAHVRSAGPVFALHVEHLSRRVGKRTLLADVSFTLLAGEVVALVGPSGAGKTTLLNAISGLVPVDSGNVWLDRAELERLIHEVPTLVGDVPQDDIVLPALTVEESLAYAAKLRLPFLTAGQRAGRVNRVLNELGLEPVRSSRIGDPEERGISGGQRKRVNMAPELLAEATRLLFLDEPTSGLDPRSAEDIARLARRLADAGRVVVIVTHDLSEAVLAQVDQLIVMAPGGHLAWFGPPAAAIAHFGVSTPAKIFERLPHRAGAEWAQAYLASDAAETWVRRRAEVGRSELRATPPPAGGVVGSWVGQWTTLTLRAARVKIRDRTSLGVLVLQPLLVGAVVLLVFQHATSGLLFLLTLSAYWFGMSAAVRELIVDRRVWRREQRVGARASAWVLSKAAVLAVAVGLQCLAIAGVATFGVHLEALGYQPLELAASLVVTGWTGVGTGLLVSSLWRRADAAVGTIVLLLVPQISLCGMLVPLDQVPAFTRALSWAVPLRYAFHVVLTRGDSLQYVRLSEWFDRPVSGELFLLGLRPAGEGSLGMPAPLLVAALVLFTAAQLTGAVWAHRTRRRRRRSAKSPIG